MNRTGLGLAGRIARAFLHSRLTPLSILAALLLGLFALATLPREEEPQIKVPLVDVQLAWPGFPAEQVARQLTTPVERRLWEIPGLEYLYSTSRADGALLVARFEVGTNPDQALARTRTRLDQAMPLLPPGAAIASVAPRSIDDVPVLALTLTAEGRDDLDQGGLRRIAAELASELRKTEGVSRVGILGGEPRVVRIEPDPGRMSETGVPLDRLLGALESAGLSFPAGAALQSGSAVELRADSPFSDADEIAALAIPSSRGSTVRLSEIARVIDGPGEPASYVFRAAKAGPFEPAVTLEISKRPGVNATALVAVLSRRVEELKSTLLSRDVQVHVTRDSGATARHKSDDLMFHLLLATVSVVALIALALGRREAVVVAVAIPVTLALTLFLFRLLGYTLNRVTLFALIFSIGILVDDAIVVVENIARHFRMKDDRDADRRIVDAVDEVGNPTVLATIAVIAAVLPLAFVRGMTGPYMKPIPIGASLAMLFSLGVAFAISPWASRRVLRAEGHRPAAKRDASREPWYDRTYRAMMARLLASPRARGAFFAAIGLLFAGAIGLVAWQVVTVKLLPFDNKSEFEVVLDMPPGTPLPRTLAVARRMGDALRRVPEVEQQVIYVGQGSPVTFNGLVRHYDFRTEPRFASIQVTLLEASGRRRQSHAIAAAVRPEITRIADAAGARVKVVEVPPGPPVVATLVAEVYGPSLEGQRDLARSVWRVFQKTEGVVDTDLMLTEGAPRMTFAVDRDRAALAGVPAGTVADAAAGLYGGRAVSLLRAPREAEPVAIGVRLSTADRGDLSALSALRLGGGAGTPLSELVRVRRDSAPPEIHHKNLRRVVFVLGDVAGRAESPVYAIAKLRPEIERLATPDGVPVHQLSTALPASDEHYALKWDGEWHMTYEVFRDMGLAFAAVLVLIYVLTVGWFRSFVTPLVIMLPIPLSLVGILPAHALLGAFFTATSMIGFIAGAGITVRNSILLVDFIELRRAQGLALREAVIDAGAVRFRPMVLTAAAVTVGGAVILFDPIFQGLAVALIGGEIAATVLSRVAVPVLYYLVRRNEEAPEVAVDRSASPGRIAGTGTLGYAAPPEPALPR